MLDKTLKSSNVLCLLARAPISYVVFSKKIEGESSKCALKKLSTCAKRVEALIELGVLILKKEDAGEEECEEEV